jgi:acetyl esterase/lipase
VTTRIVLAIAALVLVGLGVVAANTQPPKLLSFLDGVVGGGRGTRQMGDAIPFGRHGQRLDVWRPASRKGEPRPVLVFFYGGGWVKGTRDAYAFAARAYAARGFVVVVPDYRKVPGVRFPAFVQDGADAVRWTSDHIAEFGGDPRRIAVAGHSAGAYTAAMLALDPRWLAAAGLPRGTIKAAVGLSGPYDFYPYTGRAIAAMAGATPAQTQPIAFARADAPPMLLVTSSADTVVRPRNARNLALALRRLGAPVAYRNYRGLTHENIAMALSRPFRDKAPVLDDSVAFLKTALR